MARAGNDNLGWNDSWNAYGINNNNQMAQLFDLPGGGGTATSLSVYFAGDGVSVNANLGLWDANGNFLRGSDQFSCGSGSRSVNGQHWNTKDILEIDFQTGWQWYVGLFRDPAKWHVYSFDWSGGSHIAYHYDNIAHFYTYVSLTGRMCAYLTYYTTPPPSSGGIKTWNGSSFVKHPVKVWSGSAWVWRPVKTWDGSAWRRRG